MSEQAGEKSFAPSPSGGAMRHRRATSSAPRNWQPPRLSPPARCASWPSGRGCWRNWLRRCARRCCSMRRTLPASTRRPFCCGWVPQHCRRSWCWGLPCWRRQWRRSWGWARDAFLPGNLLPKPSRLSPLAGLKRMFGPQGLVELGKSLLKILVLGAISWAWAAAHLPPLLSPRARAARGTAFRSLGCDVRAVAGPGRRAGADRGGRLAGRVAAPRPAPAHDAAGGCATSTRRRRAPLRRRRRSASGSAAWRAAASPRRCGKPISF